MNSGLEESGPNFFITLGDFSHLNNKNIVIGEVTEGMEQLYDIANCGSMSGDMSTEVMISECGELGEKYKV